MSQEMIASLTACSTAWEVASRGLDISSSGRRLAAFGEFYPGVPVLESSIPQLPAGL